MNFCISTFNNRKFIFLSFFIASLMTLIQFVFLEYYTREKITVIDSQTKELIKNRNSYKLALLGTSHTNYGKDMNTINSKMFNYGREYTYPIVMYQKIKKLIEFNQNLKYLVIEADYHQFYEFSFTESTIYTRYPFLLKDINTGYENLFYSLNREIAPTLHKRVLKDIFGRKEKKEVTDNNWAELSQEERDKKTIGRYDFFKFSSDNSMNKHSIDYYQRTIELAQNNNMEVILLRHPLSNEYLNKMYANMKFDVDIYIKKLSAEYNLKILDFRYLFKDKQHLFYSTDHLNKAGQKEFAKIFVKEIILKTTFSEHQ